MAKYAFDTGLVAFTLTGGVDNVVFGDMVVARNINILMREPALLGGAVEETPNPVIASLYQKADKSDTPSIVPLASSEQWLDDDANVRAITLTGTATDKVQIQLRGDAI